MLHPVGPLPASVYWRRRGLVLVGVIVVLVLLVWLLGGGGSGDATTVAGGADSGAAPGAGASTPSGSPAQPTASGSGSLTGSPPPLDETGPGEDVGGGGSGGSAPTAATAAGSPAPLPCTDAALRLTVKPVQSVYRVGDMPVIELAVQNTSTATCIRDLGAAWQEVLLYAGTTRIWSSNDCYPGGERDVQALLPRGRATFSVKWSGLSSAPHCAGVRSQVGPGAYRLLGRLGTLRSSEATLTLADTDSGSG